MKRNPLTLAVGVVLILIFALVLFVFQVRKSEVAVVTTFGRPTRALSEPGPYLKWPWPIENVHKLDQRVQNWESKLEQGLTADGFNLLVQVYAGWRISDPRLFFPKFAGGSVGEAEHALDAMIRSAKNEVVGQHPFSDFISTDTNQLRFTAIETDMLSRVQQLSRTNNYGLEIQFVGIKRLGLPESVTKTVFERMQAERDVQISRIKNEGEEQAARIRSEADAQSYRLLADAEAKATGIRGEGEAEAAKSFAVFQQDPELASLWFRLNALDKILREKTTLILDQSTPPFDLLSSRPDVATNAQPARTAPAHR